MKPNPGKDALLEIGTEELPARFITPALAQFSELAKAALTKNGLEFTKVETWGTPRRLILHIHQLTPKAKDRTEEVVGPPPAVCKDEKGNWTQAALSFAKNQKMSLDRMGFKETPKGQRLVAVHAHQGQKAEVLLKEIFPSLIQQLTFPKP